MFPTLKELGAHDAYERAAVILEKHGFSNHTTYDPYTKEVDLWGAILLACGAKEKFLAEGVTDAEECGVAPFMCGRARFFCEYLELVTGKEIAEWCACHAQEDAISLLKKASDRIAITVLRP
jgi:hypothetical protein